VDVVVGPATPWGRGALAVVRLSGEGLEQVLGQILAPMGESALDAGRPRRVLLRDAEGTFDDGVVVVGRAPRTYTGEDVAEISCHGNPLIVERLVCAAIDAGARLARPGEFTRRAVVHGKMDLIGAEAVLHATEASSSRGLGVARAGMDGRIGSFVAGVRQELVEAVAELEARLDHPDDELALVDDDTLVSTLVAVGRRCDEVASTHAAGRVLVQGARVALVGPVNAGKSSLFNALLGRRRALVHHRPGTTRDVLEVATVVDGLSITLLDTAGERRSTDPVEAAGLALSRELIGEADLLVVVLRAGPGGPCAVGRRILARTAAQPRVVVYNGVDLPGIRPAEPGWIETVAVDGRGVQELGSRIRAAALGEEPATARLVIASARQRDLLQVVARAVDEACEALPLAGVAVSADALAGAIEAIDALTGADTREEILDALFARFCIGK